jgi:multicomponent Na+:H+ antiporter subunit C
VTSPIVLLALVGVLYTAGVYLILERSLTRVLLGVLVLGNATNVLVVVVGGRAGAPPLVGRAPEAAMSDALVQALVLTAIVITLAVTAFLLALIHRAWILEREDDLTEDVEDRSLRRRLARGEQEDEEELDTTGSENVGDTDPEEDSDPDGDRGPDGAGSPARAAASGPGSGGEGAR